MWKSSAALYALMSLATVFMLGGGIVWWKRFQWDLSEDVYITGAVCGIGGFLVWMCYLFLFGRW